MTRRGDMERDLARDCYAEAARWREAGRTMTEEDMRRAERIARHHEFRGDQHLCAAIRAEAAEVRDQ